VHGRALFRYRKADRLRTYQLREREDGTAELWVSAEGRGQEPTSRKLATLTSTDDAAVFLESIEQELRVGGWLEV
jgi:hypothetical protein